jgi:sensor histidine kinase YesM
MCHNLGHYVLDHSTTFSTVEKNYLMTMDIISRFLNIFHNYPKVGWAFSLSLFFFFLVALGFELRTSHLSHSTSQGNVFLMKKVLYQQRM